MTNILIVGGSGLIGSRLSQILINNGYQVSHLSRNPDKSKYPAFKWDLTTNYIDANCLNNVNAIINLAGAGVTDKKWSDAYKQEIYNSRINSTKLLYNLVRTTPNKVSTYISASAIGIYGLFRPEPTFETDALGTDFLADVCKDWEAEANNFNQLNIRTSIVRIGIVLAKDGGFVKQVAAPAKFGLGAALGNGKMVTSWIHIDDLCYIFMHLLLHKNLEGVFNGVAPNPVTNKQITKAICNVLIKPCFLPNVPEFAIKLAFGETASIILSSLNASANKILKADFIFKFNNAEEALNDILK